MKALVSLFLLCTILASTILAKTGWEPVDISEIPLAEPNDSINVYYLEAPLFFDKYGKTMQYLHMFHAGVGFQNLRTGQNWTVEYDALPTFNDAVVPHIEKVNGTYNLHWTNFGGAVMYLDINSTYWSSGQTKVITINGTQHNSYVEWLHGANATHPHYNLFSVWDKWSLDPQQRNIIVPPWTCFDFAWETFEVLHNLGATYDPNLKLKRNFANYFVGNNIPQKVEFKDPNHHAHIIHFFELVEMKFKSMKFIEFLIEAYRLVVGGKVYLRVNDSYYMLHLVSPHLSMKYAYAPLAGQPLWKPRPLVELVTPVAQEEAKPIPDGMIVIH